MQHRTCLASTPETPCLGNPDVPGASRGYCTKHYQKWRKYGDPLVVRNILGDDEARFWSHVDRRGDGECWPWLSYVDEDGYGMFGTNRKVRRVHAWAYEHFVGPIPKTRPSIDHTCHSDDPSCPGGPCLHRRCVNYLQHLEPVPARENVLRGRSTKLSDDMVLSLHARYIRGERSASLAAEVGVAPQTLTRRFDRLFR